MAQDTIQSVYHLNNRSCQKCANAFNLDKSKIMVSDHSIGRMIWAAERPSVIWVDQDPLHRS